MPKSNKSSLKKKSEIDFVSETDGWTTTANLVHEIEKQQNKKSVIFGPDVKYGEQLQSFLN